MTAASSRPAEPAHAPAPAPALHLATAIFVIAAVAAVCATVRARWGIGPAVLAGLAVFAILSLAAVRDGRNQPGALKIGPEGLSVWSWAGILRAEGRIVGCSQWSDSLLMLCLEEDGGRLQQLLLAVDMLDRDVFRELSVLARREARI